MVEKESGLYWNDWNQSGLEAWIEIILHALLCIIIIILVIFCLRMIYYEYGIQKQNMDGKTGSVDMRFYRYLLVSLLVSFIYFILTYFLNVLSISVFGWRPKYACFYRQIAVIPLTLQRLITYYFYVLRLHVSFHGSIAELSKKCIYLFIISVTINIIGALILYLVSIYLMNTDNNSFICGITTLRIISTSTLIVSDTFWSIIFALIYIKKLIEVTRIFNLDDDTHKIRYIVKKLSILAITSIITTHSLIIIFEISQQKFTYQWVCIDLIVNNVCIMLSFKISDKWYAKLPLTILQLHLYSNLSNIILHFCLLTCFIQLMNSQETLKARVTHTFTINNIYIYILQENI